MNFFPQITMAAKIATPVNTTPINPTTSTDSFITKKKNRTAVNSMSCSSKETALNARDGFPSLATRFLTSGLYSATTSPQAAHRRTVKTKRRELTAAHVRAHGFVESEVAMFRVKPAKKAPSDPPVVKRFSNQATIRSLRASRSSVAVFSGA